MTLILPKFHVTLIRKSIPGFLLLLGATCTLFFPCYGQTLRKGAAYVSLKTVRESGNSVFIDGDFKKFTNLDYDLRAEAGFFYTDKAALGLTVSALMNHAWGWDSESVYPNNRQRRTFANLRMELNHRNYLILNPRISLFLRSALFYERGSGRTRETQHINYGGSPSTYRSYSNTFGLAIRPGLSYRLAPRWSIEAYSPYADFSAGLRSNQETQSKFLTFSSGIVSWGQSFSLGVNYAPDGSGFKRYSKKLAPIRSDSTRWAIGGGVSVSAQKETFGNENSHKRMNSLLTIKARNFIRPDLSLNIGTDLNFTSQTNASTIQSYSFRIGLEKYFPIVRKLFIGVEGKLSYSTRRTYQELRTAGLIASMDAELLYKFSEKWSLHSTFGNMDLLQIEKSRQPENTRYYVRAPGPPSILNYFSAGLFYWIPSKK